MKGGEVEMKCPNCGAEMQSELYRKMRPGHYAPQLCYFCPNGDFGTDYTHPTKAIAEIERLQVERAEGGDTVVKRWPMPRNAHYSHYCCYCRYWEYVGDVGAAHNGICKAIRDKPTEQDAYDRPCGLWAENGRTRPRRVNDG